MGRVGIIFNPGFTGSLRVIITLFNVRCLSTFIETIYRKLIILAIDFYLCYRQFFDNC